MSDPRYTIVGVDIKKEGARILAEYEEKRRQEAEKAKTQPQVSLEGKIDYSTCIAAPFDKAKQELESQGYRIISLEENAALRMQEGRTAYSSTNGNYVREGIIYILNQGVYLTKNSPILEESEKATQCHRDNKEFYLTEKQVEKALKNAVKIDKKSIPTDNFKTDTIAQFVFGKYAERYEKFLKDAQINEMPIILTSMQDKPFATQIWFRNLGGRSELYGAGSDLDCSYRLRGIK